MNNTSNAILYMLVLEMTGSYFVAGNWKLGNLYLFYWHP